MPEIIQRSARAFSGGHLYVIQQVNSLLIKLLTRTNATDNISFTIACFSENKNTYFAVQSSFKMESVQIKKLPQIKFCNI